MKDYLIPIVRLLLGIDQAPGSGYLTSVRSIWAFRPQLVRAQITFLKFNHMFAIIFSTAVFCRQNEIVDVNLWIAI